jgi:uncharacterized repeat protein (TIGR03803 family)
LQSFGGADGANPESGLIQASNGEFYGTTVSTIYSIVPGGTPVVLANVGSDAPLIQGTDGNFYGTTAGGAADGCSGECGTVFKMTPEGAVTTLYTFDGTGGYNPQFSLVQGTDGNFYGTTAFGGSNYCGDGQPLYCGTIFKITPAGALTTLYSFCEQGDYCPDGFDPSGLIQGSDGNFYGTTLSGGGNNLGYPGFGTVFKITPAGTLTTLHAFDGTDGDEPGYGVIQGPDGNFYGTTSFGGFPPAQ